MSAQPEALRLADALSAAIKQVDADDDVIHVARWFVEDAAAELRRLSAVEAQRDALLQKITAVIAAEQSEGAARGGFIHTPPTKEHHRRVVQAWKELHAAIKAVEEEA